MTTSLIQTEELTTTTLLENKPIKTADESLIVPSEEEGFDKHKIFHSEKQNIKTVVEKSCEDADFSGSDSQQSKNDERDSVYVVQIGDESKPKCQQVIENASNNLQNVNSEISAEENNSFNHDKKCEPSVNNTQVSENDNNYHITHEEISSSLNNTQLSDRESCSLVNYSQLNDGELLSSVNNVQLSREDSSKFSENEAHISDTEINQKIDLDPLLNSKPCKAPIRPPPPMQHNHNKCVALSTSPIKPVPPYRVVNIVTAVSSSSEPKPTLQRKSLPPARPPPFHLQSFNSGPTRGARHVCSDCVQPISQIDHSSPSSIETRPTCHDHSKANKLATEASSELVEPGVLLTSPITSVDNASNPLSKNKSVKIKGNTSDRSSNALLHHVENLKRNARMSLHKVCKRVTEGTNSDKLVCSDNKVGSREKISPPPLPPPISVHKIPQQDRWMDLLKHTTEVLLPRLNTGKVGSLLTKEIDIEFQNLCLNSFTKAWRQAMPSELINVSFDQSATHYSVQPADWVAPNSMFQFGEEIFVDSVLFSATEDVDLLALQRGLCSTLPVKLDAFLSNKEISSMNATISSNSKWIVLPCNQLYRLDQFIELLIEPPQQLSRALILLTLFSAILSLRLVGNSGRYAMKNNFEMSDIVVLLSRRDTCCILNPTKLVPRSVTVEVSSGPANCLQEILIVAQRCLNHYNSDHFLFFSRLQALSDNSFDAVAWQTLLCVYFFCFNEIKKLESQTDSTEKLSDKNSPGINVGSFQKNAQLLLPTLFGNPDLITYCLAQCVLWHDRLLSMCEQSL